MTNNRKDIKEKLAKVNKKEKREMLKETKKEKNKDITNLSKEEQYSIAKDTWEKIINKKKKQEGKWLKTNILTLLQTISSLKFDNETLDKKINKSKDEIIQAYYSKLKANNETYKAVFVRPNHIKTNFIYIDEESVSLKKYFVELSVLTGFKTPMNTVFTPSALKTLENLKINNKETELKKKIGELLDSFSKQWLGMSYEESIKRAKEEDNSINSNILKLIKVKLYLDYYPNYKIPSDSFEYFENNPQIIKSTVFETILKNCKSEENLSEIKGEKSSEIKVQKISEIIREKKTNGIKWEETVYMASFNKIPFENEEELNNFIKDNNIENEINDWIFTKFFSTNKETEIISATTKEKFIGVFIPKLIEYLLDLDTVINYNDENKAKIEKMFSYEIIKDLLDALKTEIDNEISEKIEAETKQRMKKEWIILQQIVGQLKNKIKTSPDSNSNPDSNSKLFYMFNIMKKEVLIKLKDNKKKEEYKKWLKNLFFSSTEQPSEVVEKKDFIENIILQEEPKWQCSIDISNNKDSIKLGFKVKKENDIYYYTTEFFYTTTAKWILSYYESNETDINENIQTYINILKKGNEPKSYWWIITLSDTLPENFKQKIKTKIWEILLENQNEGKKEIFKKILDMLYEEMVNIENGNNNNNNIDDNKFKNRIKNLTVVKITNKGKDTVDKNNWIIELIWLSNDIKNDNYIETYSTISEKIRNIFYEMVEENDTIQNFKEKLWYNDNEKKDIENFIDVYMSLFLEGKTDADTISIKDVGKMWNITFFLTILNILLDDLKVVGKNTKISKFKLKKKTTVNNSLNKQAVKKQEKINNASKRGKEIFKLKK